MHITLNGETIETWAQNIAELLRERQMPQIGVAVACNGVVVRRADHESTPLKDGDAIEIIRAVQGG